MDKVATSESFPASVFHRAISHSTIGGGVLGQSARDTFLPGNRFHIRLQTVHVCSAEAASLDTTRAVHETPLSRFGTERRQAW